jgi:cation diffusion facilitator CzcD-associated flavoprotein CzcO
MAKTGGANTYVTGMVAPNVAIIGAGFGGIAAGVKLLEAGIHTFTIFEQSDGVGGTWRDNVYPGCEVDVGSHLYSFSFMPYDWSRNYARQPEVLRYLESVADYYGLGSHCRFNTRVLQAVWDEERAKYLVSSESADSPDIDRSEFNIVISALGILNHPRYPEWPGLEKFENRFHTARWDTGQDLRGKRVAVVGTGSTSAQLVPELAPMVEKLYVFQCEPGYVAPKGSREFSPAERDRFKHPLIRRRERLRMLMPLERTQFRGSMFRPGSKYNTMMKNVCLGFIDSSLGDRPELAASVTPDYPYPGKRNVLADTFYSALRSPNVELVPQPVVAVNEFGVEDSLGVHREIDVLVMATGFQPANFLATLEVVGRDGRSIHEIWAGEPNACFGITVPGVPNFFMLYGPNTNGGEIIHQLETQADYTVRAIKRMLESGTEWVEPSPKATAAWNRYVQKGIEGTSWQLSNNYYKAPSGRNVTQWPTTQSVYRLLVRVFGRASEVRGRRGERP